MMNKRTAELLEAHFDTAFAAPNGIQKLRELILTLAMQGKLVPQDPNDPPASELLKEIEAEKKRLVKEGKIKAPKPLPPVTEKEKPYALPEGWEWVRLNRLGYFLGGKTPSTNNESLWGGGIPWVSPKDMKVGRIQTTEDSVSELGLLSGLALIPTSSILMVVRSGILRRCFPVAINEVECTINQDLKALVPFHPKQAGFLFLMFRGMESYILSRFTKKGVTVESVVFDAFSNAAFPLPPLPEQHRIVAKIYELMARCDALEKLRTAQNEKRLAVHTAAISQLLNIAQADEHPRAQAFLAEHFGELYTVKENVAALRKAILQLAVMGKLVPQDPKDTPASELLKEIEAEKKRLVQEGKIKAPKPLPPVTEEEKPYALPEGWEWARLQDILDVRDGTHDSPKDAIGSNTYPLITSKNFVDGGIDFSNARHISAEDHFEIVKRSRVERFDILFSMIGGNIGNQIIVEEDREFSIKNVALFKYYNKAFTQPYFIKKFMEHLAIDLQQQAAGGAQPFVSLGFLRNLVIGLPPQLEQHRIVAKIDQLMALCDTLEQKIAAASQKQTELLDAVMAHMGTRSG